MPIFGLLGLLSSFALTQGTPTYKDPTKPVEDRVSDLLGRMTLEEKISLVHADSKFTTAAIPRLGIPRRWMSDGPHGVREDIGPDSWAPAGRTDDFSTWMPANICLAATWNPDMGLLFGSTIGQEAKARGKQIMLAPGVNIMRTPLNGRNFEYLGEDPFLSGRMAIGYIKGEQAQGVASCVKHFAANNQETQRNSIDVEMDDRTLREIYLPAFKAAVKEGGVLAVMGAYNRFRGQYCCENDLLLNKILKGDWGFQGLVMTDWGGSHTTNGGVLNGLDLEMGTNKPYNEYFLADAFAAGIKSGKYPMALLDDKVRRNLRVMFLTHVFDGQRLGSLNTVEHQMNSRKIAEEGMVLLKNDQATLPLDATKIKSIAVIGEDANRKFAHSGGSAEIKALYEITPLEGIIRRVGNEVNVSYSVGYIQPPRVRRGGADTAGISKTATDPAIANADRIDRAVALAKSSDVAIVFAGLNHEYGFDAEGGDRKDMKLPFGQDGLIQKVVAANPRTIIVMTSGAPVEMDAWLGQVPAVLQSWYGGMEGGNAITRVLFGDVNPSGKLPCTFPHKLEDSPAHALTAFPGKDGKETYEEGLFVGYRWYDAKNIEPLFPFGFGLSYTKFDYSKLEVKKVGDGRAEVQFDITNNGDRDGAEVAQLYVVPGKEALPRPIKELKGFKKVFLKAHETQTVTISLDVNSFSYFDPAKKAWVAEKGNYGIQVGGSSRDARLKGSYSQSSENVTPEG